MHGQSPEKFDNWIDPMKVADLHAQVVIGAAGEVHSLLGPGYRQDVYEEALCDEMALRGVPFLRHPILAVQYKGRRVGQQELDLLVGDGLIVDLFAVPELQPMDTTKMRSYLRATKMALGLLINFSVPDLNYGIKRIRAV